MDNFSDRLTMEGAWGQTDDTRLTFRVPLKILGYNGSNYIAMWKVGRIKIERTRVWYFFGGMNKKISQKWKFGMLLKNDERYWDGP